jgi:hypothetical protein
MHRPFRLSLSALALALAAGSVACKKQAAPAAAPVAPPKATAEAVAAVPPAAAATAVSAPLPVSPTWLPPDASPVAVGPAAATVIHAGDAFRFDLVGSPGAMQMAAMKCDVESGGDAKKKAECMDNVPKQAAREGIRFEKVGEQWFYVSYATKVDGKEEINLRAPIALVPGAAHEWKFRPAGPGTGSKAAEMGADKFDPAMAEQMVMTMVTVDADAIALDAGPAGRILFRRVKP